MREIWFLLFLLRQWGEMVLGFGVRRGGKALCYTALVALRTRER